MPTSFEKFCKYQARRKCIDINLMMKVPFVDLRAQYEAHRSEIDAAISRVIQNTAFIGGAPVEEFVDGFKRLLEVPCFVPCANGTDAIYIALRMLGVGPGDEVITTAHSWIATSEVITQAGARPVFVDVDEYYGIDAKGVEEKISSRTRAIIPVHLYGQALDMERLMKVATDHDLLVIEDCAQAPLATWRGQRVGTFGQAGTFSFYPGKNLGAYGDAGGIITSDSELARKMRMFSCHGSETKHLHEIEGINSRLDGLQAAILAAKLPFIESWTRCRQEIAAIYDAVLSDVPGIATPLRRPGASHVFHLYVIQTDNRDALAEHLASNGISTGVHYPTALPFLPAYQYLGHKPEDFPRSAFNQGRILSLPVYPEMSESTVEYVGDKIKLFFCR
jgi:dTDP-4-amino-4,6-dideoxygalactose transaminase